MFLFLFTITNDRICRDDNKKQTKTGRKQNEIEEHIQKNKQIGLYISFKILYSKYFCWFSV
jgi:uncharacterized protein YueI